MTMKPEGISVYLLSTNGEALIRLIMSDGVIDLKSISTDL